jgi:hypothetical protein
MDERSGASFLPVGSYRARGPSAGMRADGDGKLVNSPADHVGRYEADGMDATRQADEQAFGLRAEDAAIPVDGHRFSQHCTAGATTATNVVVGVCRT